MRPAIHENSSLKRQFLISLGLVVSVSAVCYIFSDYFGYQVVALILLVTVSFLAMFFKIWPVLVAALLSAIIWNFFFIPPKFTYAIRSTEDALMFLMYFIIATVNATLTYKFRQIEKINQIREEKERTLQLYNTMLNSLSHELRTPISTIIGATDILQNNKDSLNPQHEIDLISQISSSALHLDQQVENLLNMSRLESGFIRMRKDWTDISELLYDTVNSLEEYKQKRSVQIYIEPDLPLFKLDKRMIAQTVYNIVHNALVYTEATSRVIIQASFKAGFLQIIIEDDGPGFPCDEIDKAFDKFYRMKGAGSGGIGLGLSIAKGFIEAHDGTIELENRDPKGARFVLIVPAEFSNPNMIDNEQS